MKDAYICKHSYLPMTVTDIYSYLQIAMQICTDPCKFGNQGPTSSLWARVPQLNGFVKLLFSNTPGALGYKFRLTSQSRSFSAPYISVCVCGVFWCPHIMYVSYVCLPLVFERFLGKKDMRTTYDWVKVCCEWQSGAFYFIHERCFFVPKLASKSQFPLVVKNNLRCQTRKKKAPWYTSRWSNFLAFKFKSSFFGQYILSSRPLGGNMMWKSSNPALFLRNYWWWT